MIPDAELILGGYLREHADLIALDANVAPRTPDSTTRPWVRVTLLDPRDDPRSNIEHLLDYLVQFDCYAGSVAQEAFVGQAEASTLARTVRAALKAAQGTTLDDVVVTSVRFMGMPRIPDTDFEPARERYILTASIHMHA